MQPAKKRIIIVFSLLAFLMNVLLPFYAVASVSAVLNQPSIEKDSLAALLGDKVLICTSSGYKWVSVSELLAESSQEENEQSHDSFDCPLCHLAKDDLEICSTNTIVIALAKLSAYSFVSQWHNADYQNLKTYIYLSGGFTRAPPQALA